MNVAATEVFPALDGCIGQRLENVVPELAAHLPVTDTQVVELDDQPRGYFLLSSHDLTAGNAAIGRALVLTDITELERQSREIEQQQSQFDDFANAITHELRNAVTIVRGRLDLIDDALDPETGMGVRQNIETASNTSERMMEIVTDLSTLARFGGVVETTETVPVEPAANAAWARVATDGERLKNLASGTVEADDARLERLFENLFEFFLLRDAKVVTLHQDGDRVTITGDGTPLSGSEVEGAFAYGEPVPDAKTGMGLPVVRTLAEAHGWDISVDTAFEGGVRVVLDCSGSTDERS